MGCGSGQLALMAAKDGLAVTGVDIASNWVERARSARKRRVARAFQEADAEALPFEEASFDVVASLIGAMFAPRPDLVAKELLRVCKPGGTIAMANWTPQGFIGQMFKISLDIHCAVRDARAGAYGATKPRFVNGSANGLSDSTWSGATVRSVIPFLLRRWWSSSASTTDRSIRRLRLWTPTVGETLRHELEALWSTHNRAGRDCTTVFAEYLEVIGIRA